MATTQKDKPLPSELSPPSKKLAEEPAHVLPSEQQEPVSRNLSSDMDLASSDSAECVSTKGASPTSDRYIDSLCQITTLPQLGPQMHLNVHGHTTGHQTLSHHLAPAMQTMVGTQPVDSPQLPRNLAHLLRDSTHGGWWSMNFPRQNPNEPGQAASCSRSRLHFRHSHTQIVALIFMLVLGFGNARKCVRREFPAVRGERRGRQHTSGNDPAPYK